MANNKNTTNNSSETKRETLADKGILAEQYTQNGWFVKVYPAYAIGRVKFSFVMKGKKGEGFDIYLPIDKFDNWADDILDKTICRVIAEEKKNNEKYPKAYKIITGDNGQKHVGFAPSTIDGCFVTINGKTQKDGKNIFANVPADYYWLRTLAKKFRATSKKYYEDEAASILKAASSYRSELSNDDSEYCDVSSDAASSDNSPSKAESEPAKVTTPQTDKASLGETTSSSTEQADNDLPKEAKKKITCEKEEFVTLVSNNGKLLPDGFGNYLMNALLSDGTEFNFLLPESSARELGDEDLQSFIKSCEDSYKAGKHNCFRMRYKKGHYGENQTPVLIFLSFEKK